MNLRTLHISRRMILLLVAVFMFVAVFSCAPLIVEAQDMVSPPLNTDLDGSGSGTAGIGESGVANTQKKIEVGGLTGVIYGICTALGTGLLWLGGQLLDYSVGVLVIGMGGLIQSGFGVAIDSIWIVIRDLFNLLIIFGLIYIGFKTILGGGDYDTRKYLVALIGAALLINFSLYITKAIVDITNLTAVQIYNLMTVTGSGGTVGPGYTGISSGFMQFLNLETLAAQDHSGDLVKSTQDGSWLPNSRIIVYGFMVLIFSLVAAFVFVAGAFLMITRFVALVIFMMFSPAMFLGWVFPGFESYSRKWWKGFISNALVAPAFIFMLYLALMVAQQLQISGTLARAIGDKTGNSFTIVLMLFVVTGFVYAALVVAKELGAAGAAQAGKAGTWAQKKTLGFAKGAATRAGSFAGRNTVGRLSSAALKHYDKMEARERDVFGSKAGRMALNIATLGATSDRNVRGVLEAGAKAKYGGKISYEDDQKYDQEYRKRVSADLAEQTRTENIEAGIAATKRGVTISDKDTMKAFADAMKGVTDKQLTEGMKLEVLTNKNVAVHLTQKNIETIEKSGKYSDAHIGQIKNARNEGFKDIAKMDTSAGSAHNSYRNPEWLAQKVAGEADKMPIEVFTSDKMAPYLTPAMVEAKMKSGISKDELEKIRDTIDGAIADDMNNNPSQTKGGPDGGAYTKQWAKWANAPSGVGARLGLVHV